MDLINILFAKALNNGDATKEYVDEAIKALKGEVNADLDTLEELSKALGNDPDFFLTVKNEFDGFKTELVTNKDAATENTRFAIGVAEQNLEVPSMEEFNQLDDRKLDNTPDTWPVWTDEQQAQARENIGAADSVTVTQLKDDLTDFKDGFSRLNLFKEAELYAENSYVNIKDGKLNPASNSAYDIYIVEVDGISKYTANRTVTFALPLAEDKITATNPSLLSRLKQFDTSLYAGTKYLALSVTKTEAPIFAISKGDIASDSVAFPNWYKKDTDFIKRKIDTSCVVFEAETDTMHNGDTLIASERCDISKNTVEEFFANVISFDSLTIGHGGATHFMGSEIVINTTKVLIKSYNNRVLKEIEHNLTISDFIFVLLEKDDKTRCKVTLITKDGMFVTETNDFGGFYAVNGNIFASTTSELSNAILKFMAKDINADTWVFGDSYITLNDRNKYMTQLVDMGFANKLLTCGYGGANSAMIIKNFENLVAIHTPKRVVWAAGMNDKDLSDGANLTWRDRYSNVRDYCNNNNIELILATIPNTPSDMTANTFKNQIVRESGYRYIDFAKAVNAESDNASWYDGMLSSDNVHPAELGAKVLASRFLMDLPEII